MARQSRFIEPIDASFEELVEAVVSPRYKEDEDENKNSCPPPESSKLKSCELPCEHSNNVHENNK